MKSVVTGPLNVCHTELGVGGEFVDHLNGLSRLELLLLSLHPPPPRHLTTQSVSSVIPPLPVFSNLLKMYNHPNVFHHFTNEINSMNEICYTFIDTKYVLQ